LLSASWSPPLACGIPLLSVVAGGAAAELPVVLPVGGGDAAEACEDPVERPVEPDSFCTGRAPAAVVALGVEGALVLVLPRPAD